MLSVQDIVAETGLSLAAGAAGAGAPIRWVHITELADPTPWLSGGELLLTTGMALGSPDGQREFLRRLAGRHLAGLGFGTGFDHEALPPALVEEAERLGFPLFEVPYRLPFIAITELAFTRLVNEQHELLQRSVAIHKRLERLVLEERGLDDLVRALAAAIGGTVMVLDARGETLASRAFRRELPAEVRSALAAEVERQAAAEGTAAPFAPAHPQLTGRALALPVASRGYGRAQAWLVAAREGEGLGELERLTLEQASTVVALELMRRRVARDTERRLAGDVLAEALAGRLEAEEVAVRLSRFGVGAQAAVLVFATADPPAAEPLLDRALGELGVDGLVASRGRLLCAVVDAGDADPVGLAGRAREALVAHGLEVRAGASRVGPAGRLRRSFHEARCALEAAALLNGEAPEVASFRDLGAFQLLLSVQDEEALRLYCESVLGPLEDGEGGYGDELIRSLEAFIEHNGHWERAARELFCHRHTLRYRIGRVERLTGRDLSRARDRIEFWLALRGRELVP